MTGRVGRTDPMAPILMHASSAVLHRDTRPTRLQRSKKLTGAGPVFFQEDDRPCQWPARRCQSPRPRRANEGKRPSMRTLQVAWDRSFHRDRDDFGGYRVAVRHVRMVTEQQLQGVLAGCEFHRCLGLTATEMTVVIVGRDRLIQRW